MQTATVEAFGKPLLMGERDIPTPGARQMLVETGACGVCRTELHAARLRRLAGQTVPAVGPGP